MTGEWLISGDMKVNRVLDRSEVNAINEAAGVKDLPTLNELNKGYSKGGTIMDDYQYAEMMGNGYALGGAVEKQTRMAFADGGLPVDPVSGNEVPPGSLPEEVRDDIQVGVSAGEYIVPADVLRYYGMKFFEDLRKEAKEALTGMEQDGRMGGEPMMEEPMEEEDDLPFSTEELATEEQMSTGGYMRRYAVGGAVGSIIANPLVPMPNVPTGSQTIGVNPSVGDPLGSTQVDMGSFGGGISAMEYVTYYGPNGEKITIPFYNGNPTQVVPEGYTRTAPVEAAAPVANDRNEEHVMPFGTAQESADKLFADNFSSTDYTSQASLTKSIEDQIASLTKKQGSMLESLLPIKGAADRLNRVGDVATINANIKILEATGDTSGVARLSKIRDEKLKAEGIDIPDVKIFGMQLAGGNQWFNTATGKNGWVDPAKIARGAGGSTVKAPITSAVSPTVGTLTEQDKNRQASFDSNAYEASAKSALAASKSATTGVSSSANKASADQGKQTGKGSGIRSTTSGKGGTGKGRSDRGMAKGGLMTKK